MKISVRLAVFAVALAVLGTGRMGLAQGATDCPYADIVVESTQALDRDAVCQAARPWSEDGYRVLVYLTDYRPASEADWFAHVDQAEAAAGLRDLSQPDSFAKDGLAFEAGTATNLSWAYSLTFGERLYDTALDSDQVAGDLKEQMRQEIAAGDATAAFVGALGSAYERLHPPPSALVRSLPIFAGLVLLAGIAVVVFIVVVVPAQRRARLREHLDLLRARTSNLLLASEQLLRGDNPRDTILYQLFKGYGGDRYPEMARQVEEWLRQSREALDDAYELRQRLTDPAVTKGLSLERQVADWETVYVTLVGVSPRILQMTEEQLHTLLDPMLVLDRPTEDAQLAQQLDAIRRELAGMPLKVGLMVVKPEELDAEGILGYVDQVKAQISRLRQARDDAPGSVDQAKEERRQAGEDLPPDFFRQ